MGEGINTLRPRRTWSSGRAWPRRRTGCGAVSAGATLTTILSTNVEGFGENGAVIEWSSLFVSVVAPDMFTRAVAAVRSNKAERRRLEQHVQERTGIRPGRSWHRWLDKDRNWDEIVVPGGNHEAAVMDLVEELERGSRLTPRAAGPEATRDRAERLVYATMEGLIASLEPSRAVAAADARIRDDLRQLSADLSEVRQIVHAGDPLAHPYVDKLRVVIWTETAWFDVNGESLKAREVTAPIAKLGRGTDVDLRVRGPASEDVSRLHLILKPQGLRWTVTDYYSEHGTFEMVSASEAQPLRKNIAFPVENGMRLRLGPKLLVGFEIKRNSKDGVTPGRSDYPMRIRPHNLEEVALTLLEDRRSAGESAQVPSIGELASRLGRSRTEIKASLRDLGSLARLIRQPHFVIR